MTARYRVIIAALSAVVVILGAVLVWSLTRPNQPAATTTTPNDPAVSAAATPSFNESAGDAENHDHDHDHASDVDPNEAAWRPVVESFGRNFPDASGGGAAWRGRLIGDPQRPYVTADVTKQLATVDPANIPSGAYEGYEPQKSSEYEAAVKVNYREGWAMVLYLITDGSNWQVYAYDRWQQ